MAGRSDFLSRYPRQIKRMVSMGRMHGFLQDEHQEGAVRALFVDAHRHHKSIKLNRKIDIPKDDPAEVAAEG